MGSVAARGVTGSGFRARTGTLTLLFIAGSADRDVLLEMLESALAGGRLGPLDRDAVEEADYEPYEDDLEDEEDDFDAEDEEGLGDDLGGDDQGSPAGLPPSIGPSTLMRASSKGEQFLFVAAILERWLRNCPHGPLELGPAGAEAIAPLVCCWSATVTHALASEAMTLTELDRAVQILSYETIAEHVEAMERVGQVEALPGPGETRYALTDWMREGFAPIAAAARMELHYPEPDVAPPEALDVDAAFQLALPLLELPDGLDGTCRLDVRVPGEPSFPVGAMAEIEAGRVVSSSPLLDGDGRALITGTPVQWLDTLVDPPSLQLGVSGDLTLVHWLLIGLHETLFGLPAG
ncbi:MAG TPA: hypothetical protein VFM94_09020 [Solirubrobacterales bacterium]|nr:hypothetical protein [Solirubrobacterales bacterium]